MLCISVTPTSRTLAKVDLLNAARQGDIIECCLDHLAKEPDFNDLLDGVSKPVILSCRTPKEGGHWQGSDEDRLTLLRRAIVAGPEYVELDLDLAAKVPRFGQTKRVVSITRMDRPEHDIDSLYEEALTCQADVIKFRWPTPTLDAAWPLLAAVSQRRGIPIVGQGLGRPELTFSLLGQKYGSPWIYAALEKGMEDHPGQATVEELREIYAIDEINRQTKFVMVAGFGEQETEVVRKWNLGFRNQGIDMRCLPVRIDQQGRLAKMLDILKIRVLLPNPELGGKILPFAEHVDEKDRATGFLDMLIKQPDGWHGINTLYRSTKKHLTPLLAEAFPGESNLHRRTALVLGLGGLAKTAVSMLKEQGAIVSLTSPDEKVTPGAASELDVRYVPFQSLYDTHHDIVVLADHGLKKGSGRTQFNPSYLKPGMLVIDFASFEKEHPIAQEARERSCRMLDGRVLRSDLMNRQFQSVTGKNLTD